VAEYEGKSDRRRGEAFSEDGDTETSTSPRKCLAY